MYEVGLFAYLHIVPKSHQLIVGYARNYWVRDILPKGSVLGLYELYRWNTLRLSYEHQRGSGSHHLKFAVEWLWPSNSEMELDFVGIDAPTIPLKDGFGWQGNINYSYDLDHQWQQWSSARSDDVLVDSQYGQLLIHEPRSETQNRTITISISRHY